MGVQNQRKNLMPLFANICNVFFHKQSGVKGKKMHVKYMSRSNKGGLEWQCVCL